MKNSKLKLASLVLATVALAACSSTKDQTVNYFAGNEAQLYQQATTALKSNNFKAAEPVLTQLSLQYPFGDFSEQVKVLQAYNYYKADNYALTLASAESYLQKSSHKYADYVLLLHALASVQANRGFFQSLVNTNPADNDQSDINSALQDLGILLKQYPDSKYAPYARELAKYLTNIQAEHHYKVAQTYLKYDNPLAAYNRAMLLVYSYTDTVYAKKALGLIEQASKELKLDQSAELAAIKEKVDNFKDVEEPASKMPKVPNLMPEFLQQDTSETKK